MTQLYTPTESYQNSFTTFWAVVFTDRQNEINGPKYYQKHYRLGGGKYIQKESSDRLSMNDISVSSWMF